ncbi:MAG: A/G-specific adenine glycosylase [Promethearchaeota archaeon]
MTSILITDFYQLYYNEGLSKAVINQFQDIIYSYFKQYGRKFPFREKLKPYYVLVSEIMLQQTQTSAMSEKFLNFIQLFPDFKSLSQAPKEKVLKAWQGLGYNRRAIALKTIAEIVINEFDGNLPQTLDELKKFPQIGHNTASSIIAFAFNKPAYFIETNIRRVFIYFFFPKRNNIKDKEIEPLVEATINKKDPRTWYYALMDYGVMLKKTYPELHKRSTHYKKQKPFKGSNREIRGKILKIILKSNEISKNIIYNQFEHKKDRINNVLKQLEKEGFIILESHKIRVAK